MNKVFLQFLGYFAIIFAADQLIKWLFLQGFRWQSDFIDLVLVYNKGVAFSMLAFLEGNLKYLQIALIALLVIYLIKQKELLKSHTAAFGFILGSGCSNIFSLLALLSIHLKPIMLAGICLLFLYKYSIYPVSI